MEKSGIYFQKLERALKKNLKKRKKFQKKYSNVLRFNPYRFQWRGIHLLELLVGTVKHERRRIHGEGVF